MTSRSGRGRWERVEAARRQARLALGRDPDAGDLFSAPPKKKAPPSAGPTLTRIQYGPGIGVLLVHEAAVRLGMSRAELEAMIAAAQVKTLPTQFVRVIPTSEVERLKQAR